MRLPFPFQNRCLVFSRKASYENGLVKRAIFSHSDDVIKESQPVRDR